MTADKAKELKCCPFCGNAQEPKLWDYDYYEKDDQCDDLRYTVVCDAARDGPEKVHSGCGATCGSHKTEAEAIAAWNTRSQPPSPALPVWIATETQLPPIRELVWCHAVNELDTTHVSPLRWTGACWINRWGAEIIDTVTHWMPLPLPPLLSKTGDSK